jgi:hypothetical protein
MSDEGSYLIIDELWPKLSNLEGLLTIYPSLGLAN